MEFEQRPLGREAFDTLAARLLLKSHRRLKKSFFVDPARIIVLHRGSTPGGQLFDYANIHYVLIVQGLFL